MRFVAGRPVNAVTIESLHWLCTRLAAEDTHVFVLVMNSSRVSANTSAVSAPLIFNNMSFETALGRAQTFSREGGAIRDGDGINIGERQRLHVNHFSKSDFTNGVSRVRL